MNRHRVLTRAYYIYLDTGCTDSQQNYFTALEHERQLERIDKLSRELDAKDRLITIKASNPKSPITKFPKIDESDEEN